MRQIMLPPQAMESALTLSLLLLLATASRASQANDLCGDIRVDTVLRADMVQVLTCPTYVRPGVTLTIEAGTTVFAAASTGKAIALVVERGAKIMASGTRENPITFTTLNPTVTEFQAGGTDVRMNRFWGGLIILGRAPTVAAWVSSARLA